MELPQNRAIYRGISAAGFVLLVIVGAPSAVAGTCAEEISIVQTAIHRAGHDTAAASRAEQAAAIREGMMRKSTGRDASDVFDNLTENIATSGADAARQSAGKPTIFQHAAHLKAARMAKAEQALTHAHARDAAEDDNGCRAAVADARRILLAR